MSLNAVTAIAPLPLVATKQRRHNQFLIFAAAFSSLALLGIIYILLLRLSWRTRKTKRMARETIHEMNLFRQNLDPDNYEVLSPRPTPKKEVARHDRYTTHCKLESSDEDEEDR